MKNLILAFAIALLIAGCTNYPKPKDVVVKVNNYEISKEEFEQEFKGSDMSSIDTPQARKDFLTLLVNRVLILQDAQKKGLDKDKAFLKAVQKFWEQSLLRIAIDNKTKQIAGSTVVSDASIEAAYKNLVKEGRTDKSYDQMYNQLKWEISKAKESEAINNWLTELKNKANITINQDLLNK